MPGLSQEGMFPRSTQLTRKEGSYVRSDRLKTIRTLLKTLTKIPWEKLLVGWWWWWWWWWWWKFLLFRGHSFSFAGGSIVFSTVGGGVSNVLFGSPLIWGRWSNLTCAYFSDGWFNHQTTQNSTKTLLPPRKPTENQKNGHKKIPK